MIKYACENPEADKDVPPATYGGSDKCPIIYIQTLVGGGRQVV
jgi:hypothetical protein